MVLFSKDSKLTSTFFDVLINDLNDMGSIKWGSTISKSFIPNDHDSYFEKDMNLIDWLRQWTKDDEERRSTKPQSAHSLWLCLLASLRTVLRLSPHTHLHTHTHSHTYSYRSLGHIPFFNHRTLVPLPLNFSFPSLSPPLSSSPSLSSAATAISLRSLHG